MSVNGRRQPALTCGRVGCKQLGGRVQGTRKWVGTTEAAALLRSFGLRARIVDFLGGRQHTATGRPPGGVLMLLRPVSELDDDVAVPVIQSMDGIVLMSRNIASRHTSCPS